MVQELSWYRALAADRRYADIQTAVATDESLSPESSSQLLAELSFYGGDILPSLLARGATLEGRDSEGNSALVNCVLGAQSAYDTYQLFVDLLQSGADPNEESAFERLPLQLAIEENKPEYVVALLLFGADPSRKSNADQSNAIEIAKNCRRDWATELLRRWQRGNTARINIRA